MSGPRFFGHKLDPKAVQTKAELGLPGHSRALLITRHSPMAIAVEGSEREDSWQPRCAFHVWLADMSRIAALDKVPLPPGPNFDNNVCATQMPPNFSHKAAALGPEKEHQGSNVSTVRAGVPT